MKGKTVKGRAARVLHPPEFKAKVIDRVLQLRRAEPGKRGQSAQVAREFKIGEALVSYWLLAHQKNGPVSGLASKTIVSNGASANGHAPVSSAGPLPPVPTVTMSGLEGYIKALVVQQVSEELRRRFAGMA